MNSLIPKSCIYTLFFIVTALFANAQTNPVGIFDAHTDIGAVKIKGSVTYNAALQQYQISASGKNIWAVDDEFHFAYKKIKGDFLLRANMRLTGTSAQAHRKVGWIVRKSLEANSPHISATMHGDGLAALQYRKSAGDSTANVGTAVLQGQTSIIQLERKGNTYTMRVAREGEPFTFEQVTTLNLGDEVYAGLFTCAHDADKAETGVFSNVRIISPATSDPVFSKKYIGSQIELLD
ncbi:MAG: biopolymer transporter TolR, partial [Sphingobacteriales bacterium]